MQRDASLDARTTALASNGHSNNTITREKSAPPRSTTTGGPHHEGATSQGKAQRRPGVPLSRKPAGGSYHGSSGLPSADGAAVPLAPHLFTSGAAGSTFPGPTNVGSAPKAASQGGAGPSVSVSRRKSVYRPNKQRTSSRPGSQLDDDHEAEGTVGAADTSATERATNPFVSAAAYAAGFQRAPAETRVDAPSSLHPSTVMHTDASSLPVRMSHQRRLAVRDIICTLVSSSATLQPVVVDRPLLLSSDHCLPIRLFST